LLGLKSFPKSEGGEIERELKIINKAGRHLLQLIDDILSFSRFETEKIEIELGRVDIPELVRELDMTLHPLAEKEQDTISYEGDLEGPSLFVDRAKLKQILLNLMNNAIKFTPKGQITFTVIRGKPNKDTINFEISDTGIGMTRDQIDGLFKPFVQGDSSSTRRYGGAGLGLAISKSLAQFLGGDILVESEIGVGSTFTLEIPVIKLDSEEVLTGNGT